MRFSSFTYLVGQGLHNLKANKMMTLASMGVLIVCMILVGAAFLFGANIDSMVAYIGEQNETVAFINDDADTAAVEEAIRSIPHVAGVEFISKDQMLDEYSQRLEGYTNLKEMFQNDNPLLANYVVRADDPANISSVAAALQNVDGVRAVNSPQAMSDLFVSLQKAVTYVCYG
ncbi:MAG TPA: permease-like cell division protein FtsX, partial [Gemmiger qucibialis]|nr:permease-like cell division protein FtsX [Gemmiger qucibialis]